MDDKLRETIATSQAETKETAKVEAKETKEESPSKDAETRMGETAEPEYVSGIDISDVPIELRPKLREKLTEKAKLLEKGYQPKFQEVAALKKEIETLQDLGMSLEEAKTAIQDAAYKKRNPDVKKEVINQKQEAIAIIDEALAGVPKEKQAFLLTMKSLVNRIDRIEKLDKVLEKIDNFEKSLGGIYQERTDNRKVKLNKDVDDLSKTYGKELTDKYRDEIVSQGLKYDKTSAKQLLFIIAPDEAEQALLSKDTRKEEKKKVNDSPGSGVTSSIEKLDIKKNSIKTLIGSVTGLKR